MLKGIRLLAALALSALAAAPLAALPVNDDPKEPFEYFAYPTGVLGMPQGDPGILVTPEGWISTGKVELRFTLGLQNTPLNKRVKTLLNGRIPIYEFSQREGDLDYEFEYLGDSLDGKPQSSLIGFARVRAINRSHKTISTALGASICYQGKDHRCSHLEFSPNWKYEVKSDAVLRDGQLVVLLPGTPDSCEVLATPERDSDAVRARYQFSLKPGGSREFVFRIPYLPDSPDHANSLRKADYAFHRARTIALWKKIQNQAMRVRIPESKVENTYYANLAYLNVSLDRTDKGLIPSVNEFQYSGFWLRDGALIVRAFDVSGYQDVTKEAVEYFLRFQDKEGNFLSQEGQLDGWGETLWIFGKHYELTRDKAFAEKVYPSVKKAMDWLHANRLKTKGIDEPGFGLLPRTVIQDNEFVENGHIIGNDFWALAGLRGAILLAEATGNQADALRFRNEMEDYHGCILRAVNYMVAKYGYISPAVEPGGLQWANLKSVWPSGALAPNDLRVTKTLERVRANDFNEGLITYRADYFEPPVQKGGTLDNLHHYIGIDIAQTELLRGDQQRALDYFYALLLHTSSTHAGCEMVRTGTRDFNNNLIPHGCFAGKFIDLLRNMLVREEGDVLHLGSCLSPVWLEPGKEVSVDQAPTAFGKMGFSIRSDAGGAIVKITPPTRNRPRRIAFHLPPGFKVQSVTADGHPGTIAKDGTIYLEPETRLVNIRWEAPKGPYQSYDTAVSDFLVYYKNLMGSDKIERAQ